jgi:hypothetical protein
MNAWTDAVFRADFDAYFKLTMPMTMQPNDNDDDGDGIPDYADGFNWDGLSVNPDDEDPRRCVCAVGDQPADLCECDRHVHSGDIQRLCTAVGLAHMERQQLRLHPGLRQSPALDQACPDVTPGRGGRQRWRLRRGRDIPYGGSGFAPSKIGTTLYVEGIGPTASAGITLEFTTNYAGLATEWVCLEKAAGWVIRVDLDICNGGSDLDNGQDTGSQGGPVGDADEEKHWRLSAGQLGR